MNYKILAQKWRPQSFKDVIGQKYIVQAISNELLLKRIHHSWLLSGIRGTGKTTIARIIAKSLNCINGITATPCRKCIICQEIEKGLCLDVLEIDGASRTKVEDMKDILENIYYSPSKSRFKIYLIDEVHMLSRHSFNALLKTLEEPPKHVKFILATTEIEKIPESIISRCLCFKLKTIPEEKIFNLLKKILVKESINFDNEAIEKISYYSKGSMRDALNLLEYAINLGNGHIKIENVIEMLGIPSEKYSFLLTQSLLKKNPEKIMSYLNNINDIEIEWEEVLTEILRFLYYISVSQSYPLDWKNKIIKNYQIEIQKLSKHFNKKTVQLCYQILLNGKKELNFSPSPKIGVEMVLLRAINEMEKYL